MPIQIYNSLTRKKEEFVPLNPPQVNMYTCGVTVYDECHIGHARSLYIFDCIRKYLSFRGFKVKFVRNITDIDDKIINRANELKVDWQELVNKFIQRYYEDLELLGVEKADIEPRATENIPQMIKYIQGLIEKGYAYEAQGDVYFNVRKFVKYGQLSGQSIDQMEKGVRIELMEQKKDHLDFALWKKSKESEPFWESPWGKGRPGWHIECSVMSQKYLGVDTLDIHAGGRDLIFPHHENETAQAEALTGKQFAKYWMHGGLLTINSQKMAKSLGNFITIKNFIDKYKNADYLKLFFLSAHYSHPIDYTEEKIEEARKQKRIIDELLYKVDYWGVGAETKGVNATNDDKNKIEEISESFIKVMDDDFNTPKALSFLFGLADLGSKFISQDKKEAFLIVKSRILELMSLLGLQVREGSQVSPEVENLCKERDQAKKEKNYKRSDELRLKAEKDYHFSISDTGTCWTLVPLDLEGFENK